MVKRLYIVVHPVVFAPILAAYVALWLAPATVWYQPHSLQVAQATPGAVPAVALDRHIRHGFLGAYTVDVRDFETGNLVCGKGGSHRYRAGQSGVKQYDLPAFAGDDAKCADLPPDTYTVETCWTVLYPLWGVLPPKTVCIRSNPFKVVR